MRAIAVCLLPLVVTASLASAQPLVTHEYTSIDNVRANKYGLCKSIARSGDKENPILTERCPPGPGGWTVTMFSADARSHVWFGKQAEEGTSVPEALEGAFADPHGVIEWRIADGRPFAAIHRYFVDNASILVVHRLQPDKTSCVAAVVKPRAGLNANEQATEIADRIGPVFKCGRSAFLVNGQPQLTSSRK